MHTVESQYLLPEYLQGKLDDAQRREVELHLRECVECSREVEELRATFRELEHQKFFAPSDAYFASLIPRIRLRLEQRTSFGRVVRPLLGWIRNPVFTRLALPLATASLTFALLVQIPFEQSRTVSNDMAVTLDTDDVLANEQAVSLSEPPIEHSLAEEVLGRQLAAQLFANGAEVGLSEWLDTPTDQLLSGLSEEEVASLLQRLEERMMLQ